MLLRHGRNRYSSNMIKVRRFRVTGESISRTVGRHNYVGSSYPEGLRIQ